MTDVLSKSVTAGDQLHVTPNSAGMSGSLTIFVGQFGILDGLLGNVPHLDYGFGLPPIGSRYRDMVLSATPYLEGMWANVVYKAISKQAAIGFRINDLDDSQVRINRSQDLLLNYDGRYVTGVQRGVADYLTTNNGHITEIVRQTGAAGAKVIGLRHLDSLRCFATGDPEWPILYHDLSGKYHLMPYYSIIRIVDSPSPRVELRGLGQCAADRAWDTVIKLAAINTYFREKITGRRNLAIHIVNGITDIQLSNALTASEIEREAGGIDNTPARGFVLYHGSRIVTTMKPDPPSLVTIPIAEVPDGFNAMEERLDGYRHYAHAAGINVDEFVPRAAGLNSGMSAQVQDEAAEGQGLASWRKAWEHAITYEVMPNRTTFYLTTNDLREQQQRAQVQQTRAQTRAAQITSGEITVEVARNIAVDAGDLDRSYLSVPDQTAAGSVSDNEKLKAAEAVHTGVMVALYPNDASARAIAAIPGVTEAAADLHATLAYLGKVDEFPNGPENIFAAVREWVLENSIRSLTGTVAGYGRFLNTEDNDTNAVYFSPNVPNLAELRTNLVERLHINGIDISTDFDFTPHITVAYVPKSSPTPNYSFNPIPLTFTGVTVAFGDKQTLVAFNPTQKSKARPAAKAAVDDVIPEDLDVALSWARAAMARTDRKR